jgi:hypothetical protein
MNLTYIECIALRDLVRREISEYETNAIPQYLISLLGKLEQALLNF